MAEEDTMTDSTALPDMIPLGDSATYLLLRTKEEPLKVLRLSPGEMAGATDRVFPDLLTEEELVEYLRIASVSNAKDPHNVIEHLKRYRGLPRIHICNGVLYPKKAIQDWIEQQTKTGD